MKALDDLADIRAIMGKDSFEKTFSSILPPRPARTVAEEEEEASEEENKDEV